MIDDEAVKAIENLHRLKVEGVLTEEEFEASKQKILFGTSARRAAPKATPIAVGKPFTGELPAKEDHIGWATLALRRYADFEGRSTRREFWMFLLLANLTGLALAVLASIDLFAGVGAIASIMFGLMIIGLLLAAVPLLAVEVRRFHDQGRSGWFALINLVPYVGAFIVLAMMVIEGTPGDNQFGPDPHAEQPIIDSAPTTSTEMPWGDPPPPTALQKLWWDPHGPDVTPVSSSTWT